MWSAYIVLRIAVHGTPESREDLLGLAVRARVEEGRVARGVREREVDDLGDPGPRRGLDERAVERHAALRALVQRRS